MNIQRFTERSQEALTSAQQLAAERGNTQVEEEHLLAALLDQSEGLAPILIERAGIDPEAVRRANGQLLDRLAKAYGGVSQPSISPELRATLVRAHELI